MFLSPTNPTQCDVSQCLFETGVQKGVLIEEEIEYFKLLSYFFEVGTTRGRNGINKPKINLSILGVLYMKKFGIVSL